MMTEDPRYQAAYSAAEEAINALLTLYWANSFDADLLQTQLTTLMLLFRGCLKSPDVVWDKKKEALISSTVSRRPTGA